MMIRLRFWRSPAFLLLVGFPLLTACGGDGEGAPAQGGEPSSGTVAETASTASTERPGDQAAPARPLAPPIPPQGSGPRFSYAGPVLDLPPEPGDSGISRHETERDWAIAAGTVAWARNQGLAALPTADLVSLLAPTFVGAPYEPGTLELPGPETLVVRLATFDCVTLVEHVLVLAHLVRDPETPLPAGFGDVDSPEARAFRDRYRALLTELRYRDARIDGYASRLHYFTEWMNQGIARGLLQEVTGELGGVPDPRPIHFMTSNPDAYRQLTDDPSLVGPLREIEARLSAEPRLWIPQERIAEVEDRIRNGDLIAAVSTVDGLDIAHVGIALRHEGRLHLLHAPLVGDSVEISARPLAERMRGISGQKGIRVVRPLDRDLRP